MRKQIFNLVLILTAVLCFAIFVKERDAIGGQKIYDFKNAKIVLEMIAPVGTSKTTHHFSIGEWGAYTREETNTEIDALGMFKRNEVQIHYKDNEKNKVYNYNPNTSEASVVDYSEMVDGMKKQEMYSIDDESIKKWGGKVVRKEKYKGLDCTVVEFTDFMSTVWFHKKFPVRTISNFAGMEARTELISFEIGKADDYRLPAGTKIVKSENLSDVMDSINGNQGDNPYQQKDMEDAGQQIQDALKAFSDIFGK